MKKSRYTRYFKYPLDCLIAAFLILLTSPVLLSTILLLAIANRGSGIFFLRNVRERTEKYSGSSSLKP